MLCVSLLQLSKHKFKHANKLLLHRPLRPSSALGIQLGKSQSEFVSRCIWPPLSVDVQVQTIHDWQYNWLCHWYIIPQKCIYWFGWTLTVCFSHSLEERQTSSRGCWSAWPTPGCCTRSPSCSSQQLEMTVPGWWRWPGAEQSCNERAQVTAPRPSIHPFIHLLKPLHTHTKAHIGGRNIPWTGHKSI